MSPSTQNKIQGVHTQMAAVDKPVDKQPTTVANMNPAEQPDEKADRLRGGCPFLPLCCWPFACCLTGTAMMAGAGAAGGAAASRR